MSTRTRFRRWKKRRRRESQRSSRGSLARLPASPQANDDQQRTPSANPGVGISLADLPKQGSPTQGSKEKAPVSRDLRWRDPDLNRGHHDFQSCALPTELSRHGIDEQRALQGRSPPSPTGCRPARLVRWNTSRGGCAFQASLPGHRGPPGQIARPCLPNPAAGDRIIV